MLIPQITNFWFCAEKGYEYDETDTLSYDCIAKIIWTNLIARCLLSGASGIPEVPMKLYTKLSLFAHFSGKCIHSFHYIFKGYQIPPVPKETSRTTALWNLEYNLKTTILFSDVTSSASLFSRRIINSMPFPLTSFTDRI